MDQFFDDHPDIEKDLANHPSLINDRTYVSQHSDLAVFLNAHPQIRAEFAENPQYFLQREGQFEGSAADRDNARTNTSRYANRPPENRPPENQPQANLAGTNPNSDLTTQEVSRMDQFLDDHRDIEKQLEKNPSLINDTKYVDHHKDLARFLDEHPQVREEFAENPNTFRRRENQFEGSAADRDAVRTDRDRDANNKDLADMHKFLNSHKSIAKDLDKEPPRAKIKSTSITTRICASSSTSTSSVDLSSRTIRSISCSENTSSSGVMIIGSTIAARIRTRRKIRTSITARIRTIATKGNQRVRE